MTTARADHPVVLRADEDARVVSRRYHVHVPGLAFIITSVVLVLGAINGQNNLLFWLFGLASAALIVSGVVSGSVLMRLSLRRELPAHGQEGEALRVRYRVRNGNRFVPGMALHVEELPPRGGRGGNWPAHVGAVRTALVYVPAGGERVVDAPGEAHTRGVAEFDRVRVWTTFPFGLMKKSVTFESAQRVVVRPRCADVRTEALSLGGGHAGDYSGLHARSRGGGEFFALREYVHGESTRGVAWRASARLDRLVVRDTLDPCAPRLWITPDLPAEGPLREAVIRGCAGLARAALAGGRAVGLGVAGQEIVPARAGGRQLGAILDALGRVGRESIGEVPAPGGARDARLTVGLTPGANRVSIAELGVLVEREAPARGTTYGSRLKSLVGLGAGDGA